METIIKVFAWISSHAKLTLFVCTIFILTILVFWWGRKNKKIRDLENQLAIIQARLQIERLVIYYNTTMGELKALMEKDVKVKEEIAKIETSLGERLKKGMTAEEIAAKFREIGIRW